MSRRFFVSMVLAVILATAAGPALASPHLSEIAERVVAYGKAYYDEEKGLRHLDEQSGFVRDDNGRLNVAECTLNYAAAGFETGKEPEKVVSTIAAVLSQQDRDAASATRGLFRWFAEKGVQHDVYATLYLAPVLARLTRELAQPGGAQQESSLTESCRLALEALLAQSFTPEEEVGCLMGAGALCSLGAAVGDRAAQERGAGLVRQWLHRTAIRGATNEHRPTYDALKIGGLRWAWENAADEGARKEAETALELCYRDMLQRYHPAAATVGGAIRSAYPADYNGGGGLALYLLSADLPSALQASTEPGPLVMYFALSDYELPSDLLALATARDEAYEVRTRSPEDKETEEPETSTCTYVAPGFTLGTMTGPCDSGSIPLFATWDLPDKPTSYFYLIGGPAHLSSAQSGPLALCSLNFDYVGVARRYQVGLRGVLGARENIDGVMIDGVEWEGEPDAVAQGSSVTLQQGGSYLGVKILQCGAGERGGLPSGVKPGMIAWFGGDAGASLLLNVYGRQADYALQQPLENVRVGLLVEAAPASAYDSLEEFATVFSRRRVREQIHSREQRMRELEETDPLRPHKPKTKAEMVFVRTLEHSMMLDTGEVKLGLVEDLIGDRLLSQTLPVELPPDYLWLSPALSLNVGQAIAKALGP